MERLRARPRVIFTADVKCKFLDLLQNDADCGGSKALCAAKVGVSLGAVNRQLREDAVFSDEFTDAMQIWIDANIFRPALSRAKDGFKRPILGGQFKDTIVAHEQVYSDSIMLAMLKAHKPEFSGRPESVSAAGTPSHGVMVIPAAPTTLNQWEHEYSELAKGHQGADGPQNGEK